MPKKTTLTPVYTGPLFDPGSECVVLRGSLWFDCPCTVESVSPNGLHRVVILGKNGHTFHADVPGNLLLAQLRRKLRAEGMDHAVGIVMQDGMRMANTRTIADDILADIEKEAA